MLEMLVGDKYNLKPETLLLAAGQEGIMVSLEVLTEPFMPLPAPPNALRAAAGSAIRVIESKIGIENEYRKLLGIENLETATKSAFMDHEWLKANDPVLNRYDIFMYTDESNELYGLGGAPNEEFLKEAKSAYNDLASLYKTCKFAYGNKSIPELREELEKKLRIISSSSKSLQISPAVIYSLGYLGNKLDGLYEKIAQDSLAIIEKAGTLDSLNVECSQVIEAVLNWNADLVKARAAGDSGQVDKLSGYIGAYTKRIDDKIRSKTCS